MRRLGGAIVFVVVMGASIAAYLFIEREDSATLLGGDAKSGVTVTILSSEQLPAVHVQPSIQFFKAHLPPVRTYWVNVENIEGAELAQEIHVASLPAFVIRGLGRDDDGYAAVRQYEDDSLPGNQIVIIGAVVPSPDRLYGAVIYHGNGVGFRYELSEKALALHRVGEQNLARQAYEEHLADARKDAYVLSNLGAIYAEEGRLEEATNLFVEAIETDRYHIAAYRNLRKVLASQGDDAAERVLQVREGWVLIEKEHYHQAESSFRNVLQAEPEAARAWQGLGVALLRLGRSGEAIEPLYQAIEHGAHSASVLNSLARAKYDIGRLEEAVLLYRRALDLEPEEPILWLNLLRALQRLGQLEQAELEADRVPVGCRSEVRLAAELAQLYNRVNRPDDAKLVGLAALEVETTVDLVYWTGVALAQLGKQKEAHALLQQNVIAHPMEPERAHAYAELLATVGDVRGAKEVLTEETRRRPGDAEAHASLALLYASNELRTGDVLYMEHIEYACQFGINEAAWHAVQVKWRDVVTWNDPELDKLNGVVRRYSSMIEK